MTTISNAVVVGYWWCSRKAFLFNTTPPQLSHPYTALLEQMKRRAYDQHLSSVKAKHPNVVPGIPFAPAQGAAVYVDVVLQSGDLEASCDFVTKLPDKASVPSAVYEPGLIVGSHHVTADQKIELAFAGYVLGLLQPQKPDTGVIICANEQSHRIPLREHYAKIAAILTSIRANIAPSAQPPPVFLIDHCACCQFRTDCLEIAEKEDSLSLLSRMTSKTASAYHKKGLFTVNQLSHTFRPRRSRKPRASPVIHFKFELQALAIRTGQIYIQHLPDLPKRPIELFMDIEGVPDQGFDYLIGLLVCEGEETSYHRFWADTREGERQMWEAALTLIRAYPEVPVYHYGSYEPRAMDRATRTYQVDCAGVSSRLVNINASIYGKVYFPARSNGLKELGRLLGCTWTSSNATGLQSLVWRQQWQDSQDDQYKELLLTYNQEDCQALRTLTGELRRLSDKPDLQAKVELVGASNRKATPVGNQIHHQFDAILKSAHAGYNEKKISFRDAAAEEQTQPRKRGAQKGHRSTSRPTPKPTRVVSLAPLETCPTCLGVAVKLTKHTLERSIVDLVFTRSGCRKAITRYIGRTVFCPNCRRYHRPSLFDEDPDSKHKINTSRGWRFGRSLQAWIIYQRVDLRLSYNLIRALC